MAIKIVVLSDGTWEIIGDAAVWEITDEGYDDLCNGDYKPTGLQRKDVISIEGIR